MKKKKYSSLCTVNIKVTSSVTKNKDAFKS